MIILFIEFIIGIHELYLEKNNFINNINFSLGKLCYNNNKKFLLKLI